MVKYKVRKMAKSLLGHHCYCPMLLMWTTETGVCLQTKVVFHHIYGPLEVYSRVILYQKLSLDFWDRFQPLFQFENV